MTSGLVARRWIQMRRDGGYVLAMSALLIIPLMAFTGLAVDVGAWYARAAEIQKTSDAAALAGVAALPNGTAAALTAAREIAAQNGFVHDDADPDGIKVWGNPIGEELEQYEVTIRDGDVTQYFTTLFRDGVTVERRSVAEYIPPIRMGSPRNFLGTGTLPTWVSGLPSGAIQEQFMLSVNGPCAMAEDGDLRLSRRQGTAGGNYCNGGSANLQYQDQGYAYGIRFDQGYSAGDVVIEVFDAGMCSNSSYDNYLGNGVDFETRYTVRGPAPDPYAGPQLSDVTLDDSDCDSSDGWRNQWSALATIPASPGETYIVQVRTPDGNNGRHGANQFALRARQSGHGFRACSADEFETDNELHSVDTGIAFEDCPNVFAFQDLSVYARSQGSVAEFFLASIGPEHSGKTLVLELFDPGEGGRFLRVQDPNGDLIEPDNPAGVMSFERSVRPRFPGEATPGGGWGPVTENVVEIYHAGPAAGSGRASDPRCSGSGPACRYNERWLRLEIQLPSNIEAAYGGRTWWRIHYEFATGVDVTDRTTWSVSVVGDPVRLIE